MLFLSMASQNTLALYLIVPIWESQVEKEIWTQWVIENGMRFNLKCAHDNGRKWPSLSNSDRLRLLVYVFISRD